MSSILQRMKTIIEAKTNKVLDGLEDPNETLDLAYEKMLTGLQEVKRHLADVLTEQKRLENKIDQANKNIEKRGQEAQAALKLGKEDLAAQALGLKHDEQTKITNLETARQHIKQQVDKLRITEQNFKGKIEQFRSQKEITKASYQAAKAQVQVKQSLSGIGGNLGNVGDALTRAQDKNEEMQARADAMDELDDDVLDNLLDGGSGIHKELAEANKQSDVSDELAKMKRELEDKK